MTLDQANVNAPYPIIEVSVVAQAAIYEEWVNNQIRSMAKPSLSEGFIICKEGYFSKNGKKHQDIILFYSVQEAHVQCELYTGKFQTRKLLYAWSFSNFGQLKGNNAIFDIVPFNGANYDVEVMTYINIVSGTLLSLLGYFEKNKDNVKHVVMEKGKKALAPKHYRFRGVQRYVHSAEKAINRDRSVFWFVAEKAEKQGVGNV